jgi:hypothetical protein
VKILGLPVQFLLVVVVSVGFTIYLMASVADARVASRDQEANVSYDQPVFPGIIAESADSQGAAEDAGISFDVEAEDGEQQLWERAFLFACPLH